MRISKWRHVLALVALVFSVLTYAAEPVAAQMVRKSITALSPSELMSLRRGVAAMKALDKAGRSTAKFRRSWAYWANMHAYFGDDCEGPITGNNMQGITLWTAMTKDEKATWCTCEHGTDQFLTWHRMFIYYFEQVLRKEAKDPTLTLPYWDWATDRTLPQALRAKTYVNEQGKTVPNPLRIEGRSPSLNNGTASLSSSTISSANAMKATTYSLFSTRMESAPHGAVHCAVSQGGCPNGIMGSVATAGLDPMFYIHHANVDRLYECWLEADAYGGLPSDPAILNRQYSFPNGDGAIVKRTVRDMLTLDQLHYRYTTGAGCPAGSGSSSERVASRSAPAAAPAAAPTEDVMAGMQMADSSTGETTSTSNSETELNRGVTEVTIGVEQDGALNPSATPSVTSATVVIDGVKAAVVPGVIYIVFLADANGRRAQVGAISFFGFNSPRHNKGHGNHGSGGQRYEFDATDAVKTLGLTSSKEPSLVIEPTTGLSDSTPSAAAAEIPKNAKVSFRRAVLTVEN